MHHESADKQSARKLFRRNLVKVLAVQVLALLLLWLLQSRYAPLEGSLRFGDDRGDQIFDGRPGPLVGADVCWRHDVACIH